jgi:hypothetical protein
VAKKANNQQYGTVVHKVLCDLHYIALVMVPKQYSECFNGVLLDFILRGVVALAYSGGGAVDITEFYSPH